MKRNLKNNRVTFATVCHKKRLTGKAQRPYFPSITPPNTSEKGAKGTLYTVAGKDTLSKEVLLHGTLVAPKLKVESLALVLTGILWILNSF